MNSLPNLTDPILFKSSSQPELLQRSLSAGLCSPDFRSSSGNALINAQPQDFIIVDGKKFRVTRSPRTSLGYSSIGNSIDGICSRDKNFDQVNFEPLKKALDNANSIIARQNDQILKQVRQIESLTQQLNLEHINNDNDGDSRRASDSLNSDASDTWHTTPSNPGSRTGSGLAARRRAEALESGQKFSDLTETDSPACFPPDNILEKNGQNGMNVRTLPYAITVKTDESSSTTADSPLEGTFDTPTSLNNLMFNSENGYNNGFNNGFNRGTKDSNNNNDNKDNNNNNDNKVDRSPTFSDISLSPPSVLMTIAVTPNKDGTPGSRPPKGLAARLAMGSQDRRKLALGRRRLPQSPALSTSPAPSEHSHSRFGDDGGDTARTTESDYPDENIITPFKWKNENDSTDVHLFIAHDNPQVGSTVATRLRTEGPMHVMLESKEISGKICFILANIVYSGRIESVEGVDLENPRGSQFIICSKMTAIKADIATLPTRTRGDILEVDLEYAGLQGKVDISSKQLVTSFLFNCHSRVEVILDPSHTHMWYPYFEGHRKMAPQFRSQGVGYIRLGDEMSNYGSAFLSLDAGMSYLDDGATSIVADKTLENSPAMLRTFPGGLMQHSDEVKDSSPSLPKPSSSLKNRASDRRRSRISSGSFDTADGDNDDNKEGVAVMSHSTSASSSFRRTGSFSLNKDLEEVKEALQLLSDPDYKWAKRVEALRRLHSVIIDISTSSSGPTGGPMNYNNDIPSGLLSEIISALTLCVTKQKNPHVLRSAVCCIRVVGAFAAGTPSCGVAWRTLLLETIHLLRVSSKAVYEEAKDTLIGLQCGAAGAAKWTICMSQLNPMLADIFAGPRGKGSGGASNSSKVVQWLESMVCNEIDSHADYLIRKYEKMESFKLCDKADVSGIFSKCYQLLLHREEITRDAAVGATGALLVYDILQAAYLINPLTAWSCVSTLSLSLNVQATRVVSPVRTDLSKKDNGNAPAASSAEHLFISSLSVASAAVFNNLSKDNRRMYERVIMAATQLLSSKVNEAKSIKEKDRALKCYKLGLDNNLDNDSNLDGNGGVNGMEGNGGEGEGDDVLYCPGGDGIAFRVDKELERINVKAMVRQEIKNTVNGSNGSNSNSVNNNDNITTNNNGHNNNSSNSTNDNNDDNNNTWKIKGDSEESKLTSTEFNLEMDKLSSEWFELRLILRIPPKTELIWNTLMQVVRSAPVFYSDLNNSAITAGITRGALLRLILPYDEDTSSSDQALGSQKSAKNGYMSSASLSPRGSRRDPPDVSSGSVSDDTFAHGQEGREGVSGRLSGGVSGGADGVRGLSGKSSSSGSVSAGGGVSGVDQRVYTSLRNRAVELRGLIRVKMADEADLLQSMEATRMLNKFGMSLEKLARTSDRLPSEIVIDLEEEN